MINYSDLSWMIFPQQVCEMANMRPQETGLTATVHVMSKGGAKHGPRVKVSNIAGTFHHADNFTITNEPEPRVIGTCKLKKDHLDAIIDWVKLNRDHISHVWNNGDTMSATEVESGFKRL